MDLCKLVGQLNVKKFFLLGFSMGGWIALRFTLANKNWVKALVLANTSSEINERMKDRYIKMARLAEEKGMEAVAEKIASPAFLEKFQKENPELTGLFKEVNSE